MADIAMLVAEDYERRSRVGSDSEKQFQIGMVSWVATLGQKVNTKLGQQTIEVVKLVLEPKSQIGAEAFNGAFSA
ncbi:hypothetical protein like AT5G65207 [Hibiscus trionum]|uniref:Uncharacterized protein n=1 Tax=Hibiscus trionum TaxID=183268 RepID=A0A9W7I305_HIBTR|nr:hypothetical protein like AT5G65207 [Hibiscus trionum]